MATITAVAQPTRNPPRFLVTVEDFSGESFELQRLDPDGVLRPVREAEASTTVAGGWAGYDYEAPHGVPVRYVLPGSVQTPQVTLDTDEAWLIHPGVPALSVQVGRTDGFGATWVQRLGARTRAAARGIFQPIGRAEPIVWSDGRRRAPTAELALTTETDAAAAALDALLEDCATLLFTAHPDVGIGMPWGYVSIGDVVEDHVVQYGPHPARAWTLPYQTVARPVGGIAAAWSWGDVGTEFASWADLTRTFGSWTDLVANRRAGVIVPDPDEPETDPGTTPTTPTNPTTPTTPDPTTGGGNTSGSIATYGSGRYGVDLYGASTSTVPTNPGTGGGTTTGTARLAAYFTVAVNLTATLIPESSAPQTWGEVVTEYDDWAALAAAFDDWTALAGGST